MARFYLTIISYHNQNVVYLSRIDDFSPPKPVATCSAATKVAMQPRWITSEDSSKGRGGAYLRECEDPIVGSNLTTSALEERVGAAFF
jgi:hypothetical protein